MRTKYIVWIRVTDEHTGKLGPWLENGDGPMTQKCSERVVRELRHDFGIPVQARPVGQPPPVVGLRQ